MRGKPSHQTTMLSLVSPETVVPAEHPLRRIKALADVALAGMTRKLDRMYSKGGRRSIPPETLLKSRLLMALYSVRSDRQFCEQLGYNLLFRWFLDMSLADAPFDASTFSKNQERFLAHRIAGEFFNRIVAQADAEGLLSEDHFSVDGTLIEACASTKSFKPKDDQDDGDGNGWSDFKGNALSNDTHESKTDPEARMARKGSGKEAKLSFAGHALMENRFGLVRGLCVTLATGTCEREAAVDLLDRLPRRPRRTIGADAGYNTKSFVRQMRERGITPHVAGKSRSAIDRRTTGTTGYAVSQAVRKRIEQIFGWCKTVAGMRRSRWKGRRRTEAAMYFAATAYNLVRMQRLMPECA